MSTGTQVEVVMPQMGVSVSEGTITRWLKQPGEAVTLDEPLLEISTDKVDTEVPSPGEGVLARDPRAGGRDGRGRQRPRRDRAGRSGRGRARARHGASGRRVAGAGGDHRDRAGRGRSRRRAGATGIAAARAAGVLAPQAPRRAEPQPAAQAGPQTPGASAADVGSTTQQTHAEPQAGNGRTFVSPVVARIAAEHGVDPGAVAGTGQGGRVTKKDILAFIESGAAAPPVQQPAAEPAAPAPQQPPVEAPVSTPSRRSRQPRRPRLPRPQPPSRHLRRRHLPRRTAAHAGRPGRARPGARAAALADR